MFKSVTSLRFVLPCLVWVIICLLIAGLSSWITSAGSQSWYQELIKPAFNPPAWLFGPVWTVLYIMIGLAGGMIWLDRQQNCAGFMAYIVQLIFNFAWSFLFFGAQWIGIALLDMILLISSIIVTIILIYPRQKLAAYLLMPYAAWVSFALVLNSALFVLNR